MTTVSLSSTGIATRRRRAGWIARVPAATFLALRATFLYGEAQRWCPPPQALPPGPRSSVVEMSA
jgi:hypothetical protein